MIDHVLTLRVDAMKLSLLPVLTLGALSGVASAAPTIWGVNDHAYEAITVAGGQVPYAVAKSAAEARSFRGVQGRLVVLDPANYTPERDFVSGVIRASSPLTSYWVGATRPATGGSFLEGWAWDDGQTVPTSITSDWRLDQFEGSGATNDYAGIYYSADNYTTIWDYRVDDPADQSGGYVVEFAAPVPEPATMMALGLGVTTLLRRRRKG